MEITKDICILRQLNPAAFRPHIILTNNIL